MGAYDLSFLILNNSKNLLHIFTFFLYRSYICFFRCTGVNERGSGTSRTTAKHKSCSPAPSICAALSFWRCCAVSFHWQTPLLQQ